MVFPLIGKFMLEYLFSSVFFPPVLSMCALSARVPARLESRGENKTIQTGICRDRYLVSRAMPCMEGVPEQQDFAQLCFSQDLGRFLSPVGFLRVFFFLLLLFFALVPYPIQYHS